MESVGGLEAIEKLLQTTGLSCDDLLQKLQKYKSLQQTATTETENPTIAKEEPSTTCRRDSKEKEDKLSPTGSPLPDESNLINEASEDNDEDLNCLDPHTEDNCLLQEPDPTKENCLTNETDKTEDNKQKDEVKADEDLNYLDFHEEDNWLLQEPDAVEENCLSKETDKTEDTNQKDEVKAHEDLNCLDPEEDNCVSAKENCSFNMSDKTEETKQNDGGKADEGLNCLDPNEENSCQLQQPSAVEETNDTAKTEEIPDAVEENCLTKETEDTKQKDEVKAHEDLNCLDPHENCVPAKENCSFNMSDKTEDDGGKADEGLNCLDPNEENNCQVQQPSAAEKNCLTNDTEKTEEIKHNDEEDLNCLDPYEEDNCLLQQTDPAEGNCLTDEEDKTEMNTIERINESTPGIDEEEKDKSSTDNNDVILVSKEGGESNDSNKVAADAKTDEFEENDVSETTTILAANESSLESTKENFVDSDTHERDELDDPTPSKVGPTDYLVSRTQNVAEIEQPDATKGGETLTDDITYIANDHCYNKVRSSVENISTDSQGSKSSEEDTTTFSKSGEDLRDVLRMQLSSLRNMKRTTKCLPDLQRTSFSFRNIKRKRKSTDLISFSRLAEDEPNDNLLISQAEDTQFVILDVTGGVDRLDAESSASKEKEEEMIATPSTSGTIRIRKGAIEKSPGVTPAKNTEKSPFVSDSLDDFLNESSQLQVSYPIPKLGAEDGIIDSSKHSLFDDSLQPSRIETPQTNNYRRKKKIFKAKTVADMRRHMEKVGKLVKKKEKFLFQKPPQESSDPSIRRDSYVIYSQKKLLVATRSPVKCVAVIGQDSNSSESEKAAQNKKLSLLSDLNKKKSPSKYKPAPLSRKSFYSDLWKTEVKKLPIVLLEVMPEFGKPIDPKVVSHLPFLKEPILTEQRVNFALTALKRTADTPQLFKCQLPYSNNQKFFIVRTPQKTRIPDEDPSSVVAQVVEGLVSYVETKEFEAKPIEFDGDVVFDQDKDVIVKVNKKAANLSITKKLQYELNRLSCKVIDVGRLENEITDCPKPYCQMGCVCKSLACEALYSNHCQLVQCMFECKCPPEQREITNTKNTLSAHTVNHLDDLAKRDLAKVEREFTQTLIHTGDDVFLVGSGGRNKVRRTCKVPKKYTDFVDVYEDDFVPQCSDLKTCTVDIVRLDLKDIVPLCLYHSTYSCPCRGSFVEKQEKPQVSSCAKPREKPQESSYARPQEKPQEGSCSKPQEKPQEGARPQEKPQGGSCARARKVLPQYSLRNIDNGYNTKLKQQVRSEVASNWLAEAITDEVNSDAVIDVDREPPEESSDVVTDKQQTKPPNKRKQSFEIRSDIIDRSFAIQRRKKRFKAAASTSLNISEKTEVPVVFEGEIKVPVKDNLKMLSLIGEHRLCQDYITLIPWDKMIKGVREEGIRVWCKDGATALICTKVGVGYAPFKYSNIKSLNTSPNELVQWILTDTLPDDRPRHLMHLVLIPRRQYFTLSGYCLVNSPNGGENIASPLSIVSKGSSHVVSKESSHVVTKESSHVVSEESSHVVSKESSLVSKGSYHVVSKESSHVASKESSHVVSKESSLVSKGSYHVVRTQVIKKPTLVSQESELPLSNALSKLKHILTIDNGKAQRVIPVDDDSQKDGVDEVVIVSDEGQYTRRPKSLSRSIKCAHKDMRNRNQSLVLTVKEFSPRLVHLEREVNGEKVISVTLPKVKNVFRWRMIHLQSDFTFLSFWQRNYTVKYTDLLEVIQMAADLKSTIILRNKEFSKKFHHPFFGIYCVPKWTDRVFLGPYYSIEDSSVETLRYLGGQLVVTDVFESLKGIKPVKPHSWLYEVAQKNLNGLVIDVTSDDEEAEKNTVKTEREHFLCYPFVEELTEETLREKHPNRYIVTNIPHLGYLEAYQSKEWIEVFWPSRDRGYRFPSVPFAKLALMQYLSLIFYPIPLSFNINVIILTVVDFTSNHLMDSKYLRRDKTYVCSEFGTYEEDKLPEDLLKTYEISSLQSHIEDCKDYNEDRLVRLFALFLMNDGELSKHKEIEEILKWATSEMYILKKMEGNYLSEKADLEFMLKMNKAKLNNFVSSIPEIRQSDYKELVSAKKITTVIKSPVKLNNPKESESVETIEIVDSDEENLTVSPAGLGFQKIVKSGKIQVGDPVPDVAANKKAPRMSLLKPKVVLVSNRSLLKVNHKGKDALYKSSKNKTPVGRDGRT